MMHFAVGPLSQCFLSCVMVVTTQAAMVLGRYMQELKVWAQGEIEVATSQKARFLTGGSESSLCENNCGGQVFQGLPRCSPSVTKQPHKYLAVLIRTELHGKGLEPSTGDCPRLYLAFSNQHGLVRPAPSAIGDCFAK